jgi:hypothetical protein
MNALFNQHAITNARTRGELAFNNTGEVVGSDTTLDQLSAMKIAQHAERHFGGGRVMCRMREQTVVGAQFHLTIHFEGQRINFIELMATNANEPASGAWDAWTRENELARKAWHEAWAERTFGRPLQIMPIVLETHPEPIMPFDPGLDYPRYLEFPWGEVRSYMDEKAGAAGMMIRYKRGNGQ